MADKGLKYVGTNTIKGMAFGSQEGHKLYLGGTLIWEENLPYDAKVEYLQGDGIAYIDTGIETTSDIRIHAEVSILSTASSIIGAFGARTSGSSNQNCVLWYTDRGWMWRYRGGASGLAVSTIKGDYTLDNTVAAHTLVVSGAASGSIKLTAGSFSTNLHYYIFAINNNGSLVSSTGHDIQIKAFKMYNGSSLVRDYIPVRKDGVGYLYDKVSNDLFGNVNSSGTFTYGNDKT